jgi:hypothetical protein
MNPLNNEIGPIYGHEQLQLKDSLLQNIKAQCAIWSKLGFTIPNQEKLINTSQTLLDRYPDKALLVIPGKENDLTKLDPDISDLWKQTTNQNESNAAIVLALDITNKNLRNVDLTVAKSLVKSPLSLAQRDVVLTLGIFSKYDEYLKSIFFSRTLQGVDTTETMNMITGVSVYADRKAEIRYSETFYRSETIYKGRQFVTVEPAISY